MFVIQVRDSRDGMQQPMRIGMLEFHSLEQAKGVLSVLYRQCNLDCQLLIKVWGPKGKMLIPLEVVRELTRLMADNEFPDFKIKQTSPSKYTEKEDDE